MLMIRLQRVGRKHESTFRVVVTDKRNSVKSGKSLEVVGSYDPRTNAPALKTERIKHWIQMGAKSSDTVHNLLVSQNIIDGKKISVVPKKKIVVEAAPKAEAAPVAAAETKNPPDGGEPAVSAESSDEPKAEVAEEVVAEAVAE